MRVVASFVILAGILAACGGATETGLFDDVPQGTSVPTSSGQGGTSGVVTSSGVGGSSGTSGNASSSGSASSTSGVIVPPPKDAGPPPGPRKCSTADPNGCLANEYCQAAACGAAGICTPRAVAVHDFNPV